MFKKSYISFQQLSRINSDDLSQFRILAKWTRHSSLIDVFEIPGVSQVPTEHKIGEVGERETKQVLLKQYNFANIVLPVMNQPISFKHSASQELLHSIKSVSLSVYLTPKGKNWLNNDLYCFFQKYSLWTYWDTRQPVTHLGIVSEIFSYLNRETEWLQAAKNISGNWRDFWLPTGFSTEFRKYPFISSFLLSLPSFPLPISPLLLPPFLYLPILTSWKLQTSRQKTFSKVV